jgi:hypothetical protein
LPGNSSSGNIFSSNGAHTTMSMFSSGISNPDKVIIQHYSAFPTWGLQYKDSGDKFNFIRAGNPVLSVGLGFQSVGVNTENPAYDLDVNGNSNALTVLHAGDTLNAYTHSSPWTYAGATSRDTTIDGTCVKVRTLNIPQLTEDN